MKKLLFIILMPILLQAQWTDELYKPTVLPRTMVGGQASYFRVSIHNFEDIYSGRWGESLGAFAGIRAFGAHYITFKYGAFEKGGKNKVHQPSGLNLQMANWQEEWLKIGLRIHPQIEKKWGSYYGFGLGFYQVKEVEPISIFQTIGEKKNGDSIGTGFYLELGVDYLIWDRLAAFLEMEISSGGSRGRAGYEAMSVGGWLFSLGITVWPF